MQEQSSPEALVTPNPISRKLKLDTEISGQVLLSLFRSKTEDSKMIR